MLFRFILFTVLAYFIFRWLDRTFMPARKQSSQKRKPTNSNQTNTQSVNNKNSKSIMKDDVGEYVEFEEVDKKEE